MQGEVPVLNIASCMAENADATCRAIAAYIGEKLALEIRFVDGISWQQRERGFDEGQIHLCWLCGLPYVWKADADDASIELCVAPVMQDARYGRRAVYFSDVVVHRDSPFRAFADLRGASWAYNERRSHSGYNVVRHHLASMQESPGFFGRVVESGAHQRSLQMIVNGDIDASAIDSTVLEAELRRHPELRPAIRVIDTLGPSPMPPWVILKSLPQTLREGIARELLAMHNDAHGRDILAQWGIAHFTVVDDAHYDAIRDMARLAEQAELAA
jgi:phosphonate transport system substrate-binding protein